MAENDSGALLTGADSIPTATPAPPPVSETTAETSAPSKPLAPSLPAMPPVKGAESESPTVAFERDLRETAYKIHAQHNPPRENGRFAPRSAPEAPPTAAPISESTVSDQAPNEAPAPVDTSVPASEAPHSWSAEMKAEFASLPPKVQDYIRGRDKETTQQFTRMGQQVKAHEPYRRISEQYAEHFRQNGHTPESAFDYLARVSQELERNPEPVLGELARRHGFALQRIAPNTPVRQPQAPQVDVRAEIQRALEERSAITAIDSFAQSNPDFDELQNRIIGVIPGLRAENPHWSYERLLKEATEAARWSDPAIRERILQDQRKAEAEKALAQQAEQLRKAAESRALNVRGSINGAPAKGSWEDTLRREIEKRVPYR